MSDERENGRNSRNKGRTVTSFFGKEMLYDYAIGNLDSDRTKAIEEYLKSDREAQTDLQKIRTGMAYAQRLGEIDVDDRLLNEIKTPVSSWQMLLGRINFEQWPTGMRMAVEGLVLFVGIAAIALLIPWNKLREMRFMNGQQVILAEITHEVKTPIEITPEVVTQKDEVFPDEGQVGVTTTLTKTTTTSTTVPPTTTTAPKLAQGKTALPVVVVTTTTTSEAKHQGWLYRGLIKINNVGANNAKLVERLTELGARKAGDVDLGWRKGSGSYFHFTIPEGKYQELVNTFNEFGTLKIQKEKHDRVMQDGIIRVIVTVEESGKPAKAEPRDSAPSSPSTSIAPTTPTPAKGGGEL